MNGLPGRLTVRHIEMAKKRGDNYIFYKGHNYTLEELEDGAGIRRAKPKLKTRTNFHGIGIDNSDGASTESGSDARKGTAS